MRTTVCRHPKRLTFEQTIHHRTESNSMTEAQESPEREFWMEAKEKEMSGLIKAGVWERVRAPTNGK